MRAFTFGKFLPFHNGHLALIKFAKTTCENLVVLVCASDKENISGELRKSWIETTLKESGLSNIDVRVLNYLESELPNTSEANPAISVLWANRFNEFLPQMDHLVTSEPYGQLVAGFMKISWIDFDILRKNVPISATKIRTNPYENWNYLPNCVKKDLAIKIIISGTESVGKTYLTQQLANYFNCSKVLEARDIVPDSKTFSINDLEKVLKIHAIRIDESVLRHPISIIDTDCYITQSYCRYKFNKSIDLSPYISSNTAHLRFYLSPDVPFIQDGTRFDEIIRLELDKNHQKVLKDYGIPVIEITGSYTQRYEKVLEKISDYLKNTLYFNKF